MKKQFLTLALCALAGLSYHNASAQADSRTITVSVELKDVFGAGGGGEGGSGATGADQVTFVYDGAAKYTAQQSQVVVNQIYAVATAPYKVTVRASNANFTSTTAPTNVLPVDILRISASRTGENSFGSSITPTVSAQDIFTGGVATSVGDGYDIKYDIPVNNALATAAKEMYRTTFVFTVTGE